MPGVARRVYRRRPSAAGVGGLPCGWGITGKDGLPMKEPPHPALAQGKVRHVGDPVAFIVAETREQAQERRRAVAVDYRRAAGGRRRARRDQARRAAALRRRSRQSLLRLGARRQGGDRGSLPQSRACRAHQPRQQPARRQRDGAARGDGRIRSGDRRLHAIYHEPVSACRAPADGRVRAQHSAAQVPRRSARCRRRLRRQAVSLCRRGDDHLGGAPRSGGRSNGSASAARASSPTRKAATMSPKPSWRWTRTASSWACASTPWPILAATFRPSGPISRPTSMGRCWPASTRRRRSIAK